MKTRISKSELLKIGFTVDWDENPFYYKCKKITVFYGNYGEGKGEQKGARLIIPIIFKQHNIDINQSYSKELYFIEEIQEIYFALHGEELYVN